MYLCVCIGDACTVSWIAMCVRVCPYVLYLCVFMCTYLCMYDHWRCFHCELDGNVCSPHVCVFVIVCVCLCLCVCMYVLAMLAL